MNPGQHLLKWIICGIAAGAISCWTPQSSAVTTNVSVIDFAFNPATVTINVNDTVQWVWNCSFQHSTTSTGSLWDSGLHTGTTFTFPRQFTSSGSFPYICSLHGFSGSVNVQAAANVPPTVTITNPASGAIFSEPATIAIRATASDSDGSVTNVQFRQGAAVLTN